MQLRFVTGVVIFKILAYLTTFVEGRQLDDDFFCLCKLIGENADPQAYAQIRATQIAIGHKNDFGLEVNGTKGTLIWKQEYPEELTILLPNQPDRVYFRGAVTANDGFLGDLPEDLMAEPTIPSGHPEAFHDAFAR